MKVHETRSQAHHSADEAKVMTRKQKAESKSQEAEHSPKKAKQDNENGNPKGKSTTDIDAEFQEFCKAVRENLSVEQMREILEANDQDPSANEDEIAFKTQDLLFWGALEKCPVCGSKLQFDDRRYFCKGSYSEWSACTFSTKTPSRKEEPLKLPESFLKSPVSDLVKKCQDPSRRPCLESATAAKPFTGMVIALSGRLSRTHQYWRTKIEKHGGNVSNSVAGVTCLVVSPNERDRGGSVKLVEALERDVPVVSEAWLYDSIEKQEVQPLEDYEVAAELKVGVIESPSAELKLFGKQGVHKDTRLQEQGGQIFEKDGILYNCAFAICDRGRGLNDYCIMQLIKVPDNHLHLYCKKGRLGDDLKAEERLDDWENTNNAVQEFMRLFEVITGNEFERWEREKKFQKKPLKYYPIDMDDGVEVRHGGLSPRQLGVAAAHCKLEPMIANFIKVLCSREIYRDALTQMGLDSPDLPIGMLTDVHQNRCEEALIKFVIKVKSMIETGQKVEAVWTDFSNRWFTLMPSARPHVFRDYQDLGDHAAAAMETVRDITVASHLIGDISGSTLDDPLSDRYKKLGCSISVLEKKSDDYNMILDYLEKTYEPVKVGDIKYGISVDKIFAVEPSACPSLNEIKKLPNKFLLWCGTRSASLLRHLHKGLFPAIYPLPVPGYMFGRAIVCFDAAAEAARYGFTAVDRLEGFLVLAVVSMGDDIIEVDSPPEMDTKTLAEKKIGVKGWGRKTTDESQHTIWRDDIKVPCGRLIPSDHKDSPLEYNEYATYDPKQASIRFFVGVKYERKGMVMD